jgi:hypothetical protein
LKASNHDMAPGIHGPSTALMRPPKNHNIHSQ